MKLGIIGVGNIGRFVIENLSRPELRNYALDIIADLPVQESLLRKLAASSHCDYSTHPLTLVQRRLDVVLEASHPAAVGTYVPALLRSGASVLVMSVGAFADESLLTEARTAAVAGHSRLLLPTGAIAGLDHLKAARLAGLDEVVLTIIKSPKSLAGAPYFERHPIDLSTVVSPQVIFDGTASEAIVGFPQNVNVAVALSLATLGPDRTRVQVVCDPAAERIRSRISAKGATGELQIELSNLPSPDNPRTSYQACLSAIATLERYVNPIQLGT